MRILFWSSAFLPQIGGIGVLAAQFLPAMRARGYEYLVTASQGDRSLPSSATRQGIPVHRFPFWQSLANIDELMEVRQQVAELKRRFAPDLIHINGAGRDDFFHLVTASAHPAPLLVTLHGEWVKEADAIVKRTLQSAAWVVGCSNAILDKGQRLASEIVPRSSVIYNAVAETFVLPAPLPTPQRLLCIGRLSKEKGFDLALTAFACIVRRVPDLRLVMAGDGPERRRLENQAVEMGLKDTIQFLGWVAPENVPELINTATLVVMPSRAESLPMVALQAAQRARPVVGTRVGGLPEVVIDQETGFLVDKENPEALANAIAFLLDHPKRATRMGQAARDRVQRKFNWQQHVDSYDKLYRKLAKFD
jgi:glycogen synthase